jgi:hypothetical protein
MCFGFAFPGQSIDLFDFTHPPPVDETPNNSCSSSSSNDRRLGAGGN